MSLLFLALLGACTEQAELPPLPPVSTEGLLDDVAAQLTSARDAVEAHSRDGLANGRYGLILATYGRDEAANTAFARARILSPDAPRWAYYQAFVLRRMGDMEGALAALNDVLEQRPDQLDSLAKRAQVYFDLARFDEARVDAGRALKKEPKYPLAQYYLGRVHSQYEEWPEAVARYEQMLSDGIDAVEVHNHLGTAYRMLGDTEKAALHLERATGGSQIKIAGFDPVYRKLDELNVGDQPHIVRAAEFYRRGKVEEAIEHLEIAHAKNPDNVGTRVNLVRFYGQNGQLDKALEHFERARELDPDFAQLYSNMGLAYQYAKRYEDAVEVYRLALERNPDRATVQAEMGYALRQLGQLEEAVRHFDRSLALHPRNRDLRYVRADTLVALKRYPEAVEAYESALEPTDEKTVAVYRALARAHMLASDHEAAIAALQKGTEVAAQFGQERQRADLESDIEKVRSIAAQ